jgi:hypothetical protein
MKREKLELPIKTHLDGGSAVINLKNLTALGVLNLVVEQIL